MTAVATRIRGPWSMPDAQIVLPASATRDQWLAERRKGIGGSDASTVAGVNRWSSRYELFLDKTGQLTEKQATRRMEAGTRLEPMMRQWFTDETGIAIRRQGLVRSKANPIQQLSLDGLTEDGGIFEGKTTGWYLAEEWADGQVADHAEVQCQHALAVTGRTHAWVSVLIDGWDFQIRRVDRNQDLIDLITQMECDFWTQHVLPGVEPLPTAASLDVVKARYADVEQPSIQLAPGVIRPLIASLQSAKATKKAAETEAKEYEARIRALIGDAEVALIGDEKVATCSLIERRAYEVAATSYRQLRIIKGKK
jgi:putative phage-type endonuclease